MARLYTCVIIRMGDEPLFYDEVSTWEVYSDIATGNVSLLLSYVDGRVELLEDVYKHFSLPMSEVA